MFRAFLLVLAVLGLVLAQGCATTSGTTIVPAGIDRPVSVPPGEKVMIITPGDSTLRSGAIVPMIAPNDIYRHIENMANIDQRAQSDAYRHDEAIHRDNSYTATRTLDTLSRGAQNRQRERTYRSQNLHRTVSGLTQGYFNSQSQKTYQAPRAIRAPQQILPRRR